MSDLIPALTILHNGMLASCVAAAAVMLMLEGEFHFLW